MIDNYLYTILPFYDSVSKQNFKKEWMYNDICTVPLICSQNRLLPFQVYRASRYNTISSLEIYCYDGTLIDSILSHIPAGDIDIVSAQGKDYIIYYGKKDLTDDLDAGFYYLKLYDGVQYWYSEVFRVICFDWYVKKTVRPINGNVIIANTGIHLIID